MAITIKIKTSNPTELLDITSQIKGEVAKTGIRNGLVFVYVPHTTAAVTINEGADPSVKADIIDTINEIVPWERVYGHAEGNSPAHIKASLVGPSETILLEDGRLLLGTWQSLFFCEFDGPRRREILVKVLSD